jgi:hypothetical protein
VTETVALAVCLVGAELSLTDTVKLYDAGGGFGTVPLKEPAFCVSQEGKFAALKVYVGVPPEAVQVAE